MLHLQPSFCRPHSDSSALFLQSPPPISVASLSTSPNTTRNPNFSNFFLLPPIALFHLSKPSSLSPLSNSNYDSLSAIDGPNNDDNDDDDDDDESGPTISPTSYPDSETVSGSGVSTQVEKTGNNRRRITSRVGIHAGLGTVWNLLTDYERLADFIPGLVVSRLLEKGENFARLFQIGQQNLAFGLKFNAKGIVECYEKDLEHLPFGQRRDIEFKMIEGDFQTFEGKWSIVQVQAADANFEENEFSDRQEFQTVLSYIVTVEPKIWLPVHLVEGRLCKEVELNLLCIREEARRLMLEALGTC